MTETYQNKIVVATETAQPRVSLSRTWGYILQAPGRPALADQRLALGVLGVDLSEFGTAWHDRIARGSTRPQNQLTGRNDLLQAVQSGDTVVVAAPFCLGLSAKDAGWFLAELQSRGVTLLVNGEIERLDPGGDPAALIARVASAQNVHHVRVSKRRAAKSR